MIAGRCSPLLVTALLALAACRPSADPPPCADAQACERLAMHHHGNERIDLAARAYELALERNVEGGKSAYLLGLIHRERGASQQAIRRLSEAVAVAPGYAPARYHLGMSLLEAGQIERAIVTLERALGLASEDADVHVALGRALRQAGELERAQAALARALVLDPDHGDAHQLLGLTLQAAGRPEEAARHLDRLRWRSSSVTRDPWLFEVQRLAGSAPILVSRARVFLRAGRIATAIELLEQTAASFPERGEVQRLLGDAYHAAGRSQEAVDAWQVATRIDPDDVEARAGLAVVLLQHGQTDAAAREAGLALERAPRHAMAGVVQAAVQLRRGQTETALSNIESLVAAHPELAAAHAVHAEVLAALGRTAEAEGAFARAVELGPAR
jgi:tetratricopeptide (TPR) repeat protein